MDTWTWKDSPELMARLNDVQNNPRNENRDISTFAGLCQNEAQLRAHVEFYEAKEAA